MKNREQKSDMVRLHFRNIALLAGRRMDWREARGEMLSRLGGTDGSSGERGRVEVKPEGLGSGDARRDKGGILRNSSSPVWEHSGGSCRVGAHKRGAVSEEGG